MTATLHFAEEPLDDVARAETAPVGLGESIEGQAGFQVAPQASHRRGIDRLILGTEGGDSLVSLLPVGLVEQRPQFGLDVLPVLVWQVTQHILHL